MTEEDGKNRRYEPPVMMPLGALARGIGAECTAGSGIVGGECKFGGLGGTNCHTGGSPASGECSSGTLPA